MERNHEALIAFIDGSTDVRSCEMQISGFGFRFGQNHRDSINAGFARAAHEP
jgi:hypothetical protein